jgi:lysophospholipase L1-like esterase
MYKKLIIIFIILISCGKPKGYSSYVQQTISKLEAGAQITIVALGDSITLGYGTTNNYPNMWAEALKQKYPNAVIKMVNSGVSGDTAEGGLMRLKSDVIKYKPDLVTIAFGLNDLKKGWTKQEFKSNLKKIIEEIKAHTQAEILILTTSIVNVLFFTQYIAPYNKVIRQVSKEYNIGLVDINRAWKERIKKTPINTLLIDGIHPNIEGYKIFVDELMKFFY